jgi:hypothetical protein
MKPFIMFFLIVGLLVGALAYSDTNNGRRIVCQLHGKNYIDISQTPGIEFMICESDESVNP